MEPESAQNLIKSYQEFSEEVRQRMISEGANTAVATRMLLLSLALSISAKNILETGYDAGFTTRVLALTGANVTCIDNGISYPEVKLPAEQMLATMPNVALHKGDALEFLRGLPDHSFDLIFIDDNHNLEHERLEAVETIRLLTPGGIVAFHDTALHKLWDMIESVFGGWQKIDLPSLSQLNSRLDCGIGIVRKPKGDCA